VLSTSKPDFLEATTAPLKGEVSSSYLLPGSRLNTQLAKSPLKKGYGFALNRGCKCFSVTCFILFLFPCKRWNSLERLREHGHFLLVSPIALGCPFFSPAACQHVFSDLMALLLWGSCMGKQTAAASEGYKYFYSWGGSSSPTGSGTPGLYSWLFCRPAVLFCSFQ